MLTVALTLAACGVNGEAAVLLERIVQVESGGVPYALNVNGDFELVRQPTSHAEAVAMANWLVAHGHNFDAGLAQVNSRNFARLGLTVETVLEPCSNLRAARQVLTECRDRAVQQLGEGERAIAAALSCYNTGNFTLGLKNGYVAAVQSGSGAARPVASGAIQDSTKDRFTEPKARSADVGDLGSRAKDVFGQGRGT